MTALIQVDNTPLAILNAAKSQVSQDMADGISGAKFNRISIRGSKFRIIEGGREVHVSRDEEMNVIILGAQKKHSRVFYFKAYEEEEAKEKPDCYSNDGDMPARDAPHRQSTSCATCPQNEKGSAKQGDGRACAFKKRLVVTTADQFADPDTPLKLYVFNVNGMSMFGDGKPESTLFSLGGYSSWVAQPRPPGLPNGIPLPAIVTRVVMQDKSVPAVLFGPPIGENNTMVWLPKDQVKRALEAEHDPEVKRLLAMSAADENAAEGGKTETATATNNKANYAMTAPKPQAASNPTGQHWIDFLRDHGAEEDDIELIIGVGGPETSKGYKLMIASIDADLPDDLNLALEAPAAGGLSFEDWARSVGVDDETLELVADAGGPFEGRGAKLWAKLVGEAIPAQYHPGAAAAAPVARISWQVFAQSLEDSDNETIEMIEEAGGPATPKGAKLWAKLIGVDIPANVDQTNGDGKPAAAPAAEPAAAPAATRRGRKPNAAKAAEAAATAPAPAPAPTPSAAPAPAADGAAETLASAFSKFD